MVTIATIRNSSWLALYNLLETGISSITSENIFSTMNDDLIASTGYPVVIIDKPIVGMKRETLNWDGIKGAEINFAIRIYHNSAQNAEQLADEISDRLVTKWRTLVGNGLHNMDMPPGDTDSYREDNKKIHVQLLNINFTYKGTS